jgi:hypothetical protein
LRRLDTRIAVPRFSGEAGPIISAVRVAFTVGFELLR